MDEQVIRRCMQNDRKAQQLVFDTYYTKMMTVAKRYVFNEQEVADVVNEAFLNVFKYMKQYSFKGSFGGWIRRIVINKSLDHIRSNENYKKHIELPEEAPKQYIQDVELPENLAIEELYQMIDQLSPVTKMVFNMFAIDGFTHKEIGGQLKISEGTSRWHLNRARVRLQKMIAKVSNIPTER